MPPSTPGALAPASPRVTHAQTPAHVGYNDQLGQATVAEVVPPRSATLHRRSSLSRINFEGLHWSATGSLAPDSSSPGSPRGKDTWADLPDLQVATELLAKRQPMLLLLRRATVDSHKLLRPAEQNPLIPVGPEAPLDEPQFVDSDASAVALCLKFRLTPADLDAASAAVGHPEHLERVGELVAAAPLAVSSAMPMSPTFPGHKRSGGGSMIVNAPGSPSSPGLAGGQSVFAKRLSRKQSAPGALGIARSGSSDGGGDGGGGGGGSPAASPKRMSSRGAGLNLTVTVPFPGSPTGAHLAGIPPPSPSSPGSGGYFDLDSPGFPGGPGSPLGSSGKRLGRKASARSSGTKGPGGGAAVAEATVAEAVPPSAAALSRRNSQRRISLASGDSQSGSQFGADSAFASFSTANGSSFGSSTTDSARSSVQSAAAPPAAAAGFSGKGTSAASAAVAAAALGVFPSSASSAAAEAEARKALGYIPDSESSSAKASQASGTAAASESNRFSVKLARASESSGSSTAALPATAAAAAAASESNRFSVKLARASESSGSSTAALPATSAHGKKGDAAALDSAGAAALAKAKAKQPEAKGSCCAVQ